MSDFFGVKGMLYTPERRKACLSRSFRKKNYGRNFRIILFFSFLHCRLLFQNSLFLPLLHFPGS